ncbi:MAG TPA: hypothetical protein VK717_05240 [Opitutaceae bacterium]|jgi:hypothetical protein|nr:hypothetical protein [Opitutaceae bacterium]
MKFHRWFSFASLAALAFFPLLRAADVAGDPVFTIDVPGGLGTSSVHDAVKAAAVGREYLIKEDKPDELVLALTHRKYEAHFTVVFDAKSVKLYSDSYEIDGSGARTKKTVPELWVRFLHEDLTANLDKAATPGLVGDFVWTMDTPRGLSAPEVHDIVKAAVIAREYSIKEDKPDRLIFGLTHRSHEAHFTVVFDAKSVRLYSDSYEIDGSGAREGKEVPDNWVQNLHEDFTENLGKAAALKK